MPAGHTVTITPSDAHVEVRLGDLILAASDRSLRLDESGLPPRYYLPKDDVRMDLLRPTTFHTSCPFKGEASYWSLDLDGVVRDGLAWGYETPIEMAAPIAGHVSFYPDQVEISVDDTPLSS